MLAVPCAAGEAWQVLRLEQGLGDFCSCGRCAPVKLQSPMPDHAGRVRVRAHGVVGRAGFEEHSRRSATVGNPRSSRKKMANLGHFFSDDDSSPEIPVTCDRVTHPRLGGSHQRNDPRHHAKSRRANLKNRGAGAREWVTRGARPPSPSRRSAREKREVFGGSSF